MKDLCSTHTASPERAFTQAAQKNAGHLVTDPKCAVLPNLLDFPVGEKMDWALKAHGFACIMAPLRSSEAVILSACCFLTAFFVLSPASSYLGGISLVTTQAVWQLCLCLGLPACLGDPTGKQQVWCFWKTLDLPCAYNTETCAWSFQTSCCHKGLGGRGNPHGTFHPITKPWGTLFCFFSGGTLWLCKSSWDLSGTRQAKWARMSLQQDLHGSQEGWMKAVV